MKYTQNLKNVKKWSTKWSKIFCQTSRNLKVPPDSLISINDFHFGVPISVSRSSARPQALLILIILLQFQILAAPKWVLKLSGEQYIINDVLLRRENMCKQIDISYLETVLLSVPFNKLPMVAP